MKQWKKLNKKIAAFGLLAILFLFPVQSVQAEGIEAAGIEVEQPEAAVLGAGGQTTLKVTSATEKTAKKIHALLDKSKSVVLKIKGSKTSTKKVIQNLQKAIGKVNKQGILFQHDGGKKNKSYYLYTISTVNAKLYHYSIQASQTIYEHAKASAKEYEEDIKFNFYKWCYGEFMKNYDDYVKKNPQEKILIEGYRTNEAEYNHFKGRTPENKTVVTIFESYNDRYASSTLAMENTVWNWIYFVTNHEECVKIQGMKEDMSELSPVMKLCVFDLGYLVSTDSSKKSYNSYKTDWERMKALAKGEAERDCENAARFTILLLKQWGIPAYYNSSSWLKHSWVVVKAKNSSGKTLWIPYDYGIGPCELKDVDYSDPRLCTEEARYKLYLSGIKGAPKKKNFTMADFK